jgi:hypothetical protein
MLMQNSMIIGRFQTASVVSGPSAEVIGQSIRVRRCALRREGWARGLDRTDHSLAGSWSGSPLTALSLSGSSWRCPVQQETVVRDLEISS